MPGLNVIGDQLKNFFTFEQLLFVVANTPGKIELQIKKDPNKPGLEKLKAEFGLPIPIANEKPQPGMIVKPGVTVGGKVESQGIITQRGGCTWKTTVFSIAKSAAEKLRHRPISLLNAVTNR